MTPETFIPSPQPTTLPSPPVWCSVNFCSQSGCYGSWVLSQRRIFGGIFLNTHIQMLRNSTLTNPSPSRWVRQKAARSINTVKCLERMSLQRAGGGAGRAEGGRSTLWQGVCFLPSNAASEDVFHFWTRKQQLHFKLHWLRTEKHNLAWVPCWPFRTDWSVTPY